MSSDCGKESESSLLSAAGERYQSKVVELNFSLDSGMEEEPAPTQGTSGDDDSDHEEIVCKRKVKRQAILDDDDDDSDEGGEKEPRSRSPSDENKENEPVENIVDGANDDDLKLNFEMENDDNVAQEDNDDKIEGEIRDDDPMEPVTLRMEFKDKDLFDAESDEENAPALSNDENSEQDSTQEVDNEGENDEGFDESQIDPKLLAKLKKLKGASKTPKQKEKLSRKAKPTAEQMSEIYSESQRMARDSRVNLPYYEPEVKSLDDFLARASKKKLEYSVLNKPKDIQKALIIHEKLSVTPPKQSPSVKNSRLSLKGKEAKIGSQETLAATGNIVISNDSGIQSQDLLPISQASTLILGDGVSKESCADAPALIENDDDELPDINPIPTHTASETVSQEVESHLNPLSQSENEVEKCKLSPVNGNSQAVQSSKAVEENNQEEIEIASLQKDPSRDLFSSLTTEEQLEEAENHDLCIEIDNGTKDDRASGHEIQDEVISSDDPFSTCAKSQAHEDLETKDMADNKDESPNSKPSKLTLLERLQQQGLMVVPDLPKLSGSPDSVINFDNETPSMTPRDHGVLKLMDRLVQHNTKKKPHSSYDVNLSIIEKESGEGDQKELKLKSVTYHVEEENEELPNTAPGAKLLLLKEKLGVGMKMKREEARMRRQQMFNLENEEGFEEKAESDNEAEEEAEMTDSESSSDEEVGGLMGMMDESDDERDYNPLLDTEARDDDDDEEGEDYGIDEDSEDVRLRFEVSDEEDEDDNEKEESDGNEEDDEELEEQGESTPVKGKRKAHRILSDDEEEDFSNLHSDTKASVKEIEHLSDVESLPEVELTPLTKHFQDTQYHRENSRSPELYGPSTFDESSNSTRHGDNLNDSGSCYNPHSQMLDADGYLKMTQTQRAPKSRISLLVDGPGDNAIMDGFESSGKLTAGKIFGGMSGRIDSQPDNMSELLGLCSGTFQQNSLSEDGINPSQNRRHEENRRYEEDDESELSNPFRIVDNADDENKTEKRKRIKPVLSDSEDDERQADTDIEEESNDLPISDKFTGFKNKIGKGIRREFLEDEAELSGSEYDSDENLDLAEEDDILEEEAGDRDMAGVSEEALRNQVGKVHMKQLQDEDDRAVLRFKEMYLQDGDLHSDGNGRMRHFRWKEMGGESSQQDMFEHQSDEEHVEEDAEDIKWRKERIDREKFLEESQQGDGERNKELHKFGQLFMKKRDSTSSLHKIAPIPQKQSTPSENKQPSLKKKGSFLSRGKDAFVKFAQIAKTAMGGTKQKSRSFVFQSKENQEGEENEVEIMPQPMQPPKRKAHSVPSANNSQPAKKPRLSTNSTKAPPPVKRQGSIFNLMDP